MSLITVFTPIYNRRAILKRVYQSLSDQTFRDFEWLIIDDGSFDNTRGIVSAFEHDATFPIRYYYQFNAGKHTAINKAVSLTDSKFFVIADSDDSFKPESLEVFINEWTLIPENQREEYQGIICKCYDASSGKNIGDFQGNRIDANELDAGFKLQFRFEKWSFFRIDVLREFLFPEPKEKLKFYPETVVWQRMSRKYKTRYINVSLRAYYKDQENALTSDNNLRYAENVYLWQHCINDVMDYAKYSILLFLKSSFRFTIVLNGR